MAHRMKVGFVAGFAGAIILIAIMYLMQAAGITGTPGFVANYRAVMGASPPADHILAGVIFAVSGGIWGLIFAALVRNPSALKGLLFGLLPSLFLWLVVAPWTGKPLFNGFAPQGIILPLIFNMLIWGNFVGWYCGSRIR